MTLRMLLISIGKLLMPIKEKNHKMAAKYLKKDLLSAKDGLIAILEHI